VKEDGHGGFIVSGNFDLSRLADMLDYHAEEDIESTTIGGLMMEWLGRVPKAGKPLSGTASARRFWRATTSASRRCA